MTRSVFLLSLLPIALAAGEPAGAVSEVAKGWRSAVIKQDNAALQKLLADDLTYTHASGKTQGKAEYIASITAGPPNYESFTESDTKIRMYGNTAILTGFVDVKLTRRAPYRVKTIEIYVQRNGQWQLTAKQSARITD